VTGHGIDNHLCALECLARQQQRQQQHQDCGHQPAAAAAAAAREEDGEEEQEGQQLPAAVFAHRLWHELFRFPLSTSQVLTHSLTRRWWCAPGMCRMKYQNTEYGIRHIPGVHCANIYFPKNYKLKL
jgi:hypothetical protein